MSNRKPKEETEGLLDFDLEKLFRGEVAPNVADEIAATRVFSCSTKETEGD